MPKTMPAPVVLDRPFASSISKQEVPECPACASSQRRLRFSVKEHEYTTTTDDEFPLMVCEDCGAWYLDPRPHVSALDIIYPPNYFLHVAESKAGDDEAPARRNLFASLQYLMFKRRIRPIGRHIALSSEKTWLDVGCGTGAVLRSMLEVYGITGVGIDFSEGAVGICRKRGFEAHAVRFEDYEPGPGEAYDLIHSSHVIEHLESPFEYMRKCFDLLKPGGINAFITPNTAAWEARRLGTHWGGLHVSRHWTMLDPESAKHLGDRVGFEHLETCFSTNGVFWGWSLHSLALSRFGAGLADRIFPSDQRLIESRFLNLVRNGILTIWDALNLLLFRQTANMLVIFRKPTAS